MQKQTDCIYLSIPSDTPPFSLARKIGARAILESAHARSYYGAGDRRKSKGAFAHLKAP